MKCWTTPTFCGVLLFSSSLQEEKTLASKRSSRFCALTGFNTNASPSVWDWLFSRQTCCFLSWSAHGTNKISCWFFTPYRIPKNLIPEISVKNSLGSLMSFLVTADIFTKSKWSMWVGASGVYTDSVKMCGTEVQHIVIKFELYKGYWTCTGSSYVCYID